jgi:hypothetical protein
MPRPTRGALRQIARQIREAHLRATPDEAVELGRLERLIRCQAISPPEARTILRGVLRGQRERDHTR